jgi:hypothetical protein
MTDPADDKVDAAALTGVSEAALMTLNGRAYQAAHPNSIIDDPMAIELWLSTGAHWHFSARIPRPLSSHWQKASKPASGGCLLRYQIRDSIGYQLIWNRLSSFDGSCCRLPRESPTSRSPLSTTVGWTRSTAATGCSSPPRAC